ncbi:hypothetical protein B0H16DRAFT_1732583 [Mycena metata]|uniref:Uncharacterized protein n=1 Tax=Mycena metata TaxID=1033252 RepID=A0AAD7MUM1_9AGAR|nr:hypothetical protein B0H16DRAFT_1732583 [Mycena metata]
MSSLPRAPNVFPPRTANVFLSIVFPRPERLPSPAVFPPPRPPTSSLPCPQCFPPPPPTSSSPPPPTSSLPAPNVPPPPPPPQCLPRGPNICNAARQTLPPNVPPPPPPPPPPPDVFLPRAPTSSPHRGPNVCNAARQTLPPRTRSPALVLLHPRSPARTHSFPSQAPHLAEPSDFETSARTSSRWLRPRVIRRAVWREEERERDRKWCRVGLGGSGRRSGAFDRGGLMSCLALFNLALFSLALSYLPLISKV